MTPKNTVDPEGDDSLGVLDDTASSDTIAIGPLGGTEQVSVALPTGGEDDDLVDDEVVGGEVVSDLIIDTSAVADEDTLARISQETPEIVIELPAEELPGGPAAEPEIVPESEDVAESVVEPEIVPESEIVPEPEIVPVGVTEASAAQRGSDENIDDIVDAEVVTATGAVRAATAATSAAPDGQAPAPAAGSARAGKPAGGSAAKRKATAGRATSKAGNRSTGAASGRGAASESTASRAAAASDGAGAAGAASARTAPGTGIASEPKSIPGSGRRPQDAAAVKPKRRAASPGKGNSGKAGDEASAGAPASSTSADVSAHRPGSSASASDAGTAARSASEQPAVEAQGLSHLESVVAAAKAELQQAMSPSRPTMTDGAPTRSAAETAEENRPVATDDRTPAGRPAGESIRPVPEQTRPAPEVELSSKRLDDLTDSGRESADLLTADRLLDPSRVTKPEPEGAWSHLLYAVSGGRINVGDGRRARERKELSARIAAPMTGSARFVPVLSRKGGVGKTAVTALLGMALADARDDRVIALDANPDRGTLAERVVGGHAKSVRDLVRAQHDIRGFHDISALVARDETRLDVLASDSDPRVSEAFGDADYRDVAAVAAQYYSLVLTDSGTGIVHSVMDATLALADQIVVVSGLSVDEARLASETLTWLESNGYVQLARDAIVVLNQSTPGAPLVRLGELESHFSTRARHVLRIPYDPQIAGGGPIDYGSLQPATRRAAREIAAVLVEGLRAKAA